MLTNAQSWSELVARQKSRRIQTFESLWFNLPRRQKLERKQRDRVGDGEYFRGSTRIL